MIHYDVIVVGGDSGGLWRLLRLLARLATK